MRSLLLLHPSSLTGENYGVHVQHIASMQHLLGAGSGWVVNALDPFHPDFPTLALESDVVVVHGLPHREIESLIRLRRAAGLRTVFEISDNFLDLGPWLPRRHLLRSPLVRQNILFHAASCDAIQVYAPGLAELFAHVNPNIIQFDPWIPIAERPLKGDRFIFGWGGTTSHEHDLAVVAPSIEAFCRRHPDVVFAFMGDGAMFSRLFGALPEEQTIVRPFGDFNTYLEFVRTLHAGLAPLGDTGFNAARSDTKFATYAACGAVAVLQDARPHRVHQERALLFRTPGELEAILESLIADRARVATIADAAYQWVARHRSEDALRQQRISAYEQLAPNGSSATARKAGSTPQYALQVASASKAESPVSLDVLRGIAHDHPDYAPAQLLAARALESAGCAGEALDLLTRCLPSPLYADLLAETRARLARHARPAEAEQHLAAIASPAVRLRLQHRLMTDPLSFYRAMLEHQPYDYFALAAVIRLLEKDAETPELAELYARATLVAPEMVPVARRPETLARFLPA